MSIKVSAHLHMYEWDFSLEHEKQEEIFDNLVNCDYPEQVILIALEKFGEKQFAIKAWILKNAYHYEQHEPEGAETDTEIDEEMESESESELESDLDVPSASIPLLSPKGRFTPVDRKC